MNPRTYHGQWRVRDKFFTQKYDALRHATETNADNAELEFLYHNDVWAKFDRTLLGKVPLTTLYRERAQQLRDTYQHIVLYYSGGSDSHNILRSFLDNNIKLDEICVRWPASVIGSTIYTPNLTDLSARNYHSEWDFAIKPVLDIIKHTHPEITITIQDYIEDLSGSVLDTAFINTDHIHSLAMVANTTISETAQEKLDLGKTVCHLYGIDKPILEIDSQNRVWMKFSDLAAGMLFAGNDDRSVAEGFYWAPSLPILTLEMSYQVAMYYNVHVDKRKFLSWSKAPLWDWKWNAEVIQTQNVIAKSVCYTTWDDRFQVNKSLMRDRSDKFFWFHEHPEFAPLLDIYKNNAMARTSEINPRFLKMGTNGIADYAMMSTIPVYITTLSEINNAT